MSRSTDPKYDAAGHHVVVADFDNDGDDEFLIGMRGPAPAQGRLVLQARRAGEHAARTAGEHGVHGPDRRRGLQRCGRLDFAITSYDTVGYYRTENPKVRLYTNAYAWPSPVMPPPGGDG